MLACSAADNRPSPRASDLGAPLAFRAWASTVVTTKETHAMQNTTSGEAEIVEPATVTQEAEHVYVSTIVNPHAGNQIVTAHKSEEGATGQVDEMAGVWGIDRDALQADVIKLPLLP